MMCCRKPFIYLHLQFALAIAVSLMAVPAAAQTLQMAPPNPAFEAWRQTGPAKSDGHVLGHIPVPYLRTQAPEPPAEKGRKAYPSSYDLRTLGGVTAVRDQGNCGSCWAHAAMGSAEGWLLRNTSQTWDFSENHMKNYHGFDWGPCDGGNDTIACAYLARGDGPVLESDDPYNDFDDRPSPGGPKQKQLQSMLRFDTADEIKQALMTYGTLSVSMYWDLGYYNPADATYYCSLTGQPSNHGVTLVGWDDSKVVTGGPQANPPSGAWIIKNSWGTGWGHSGYFYISYSDTNAVVCPDGAFSYSPMEEAQYYGRIYQYDDLGAVYTIGYLGGTPNTIWGANIFTPVANESLSAVAFYTNGPNTSYAIDVYDNFNGSSFSGLLGSKSGILTDEGYQTVALTTPIALTAGNQFTVRLRLTTAGCDYPMSVEFPYPGYASGAIIETGVSFLSPDGTSWEDGAPDYNVCLKALTVGVPPGTCYTPVFYPSSGDYTGPIFITCVTSGASIHYTTNGDEPTQSSTLYTAPITLTETTTIKAKAFKDGMTASATAVATYTFAGTFCEAVDNCDITWSQTGTGLWSAQTTITHDGVDAAKSPDLDDNEYCFFEANIMGPCQLSFWWKVSSEQNYDYLKFYVDDSMQQQISGATGWAQVVYAVPAGTHNVAWIFEKDYMVSDNDDCGWVDQISIGAGSLTVTDSILPADDQVVAFETMTEGLSHIEHVTLRNSHSINPLTVSYIGIGDRFREDFDSGVAAGWIPCHQAHWSVVSGEYVAQTSDTEMMQSVYAGGTWTDCSAQAVVRRTGDMYNGGGVVLRASEDFNLDSLTGSGYVGLIDGSGYYVVGRLYAGASTPINGGWTQSPSLNLGTASNVIKLTAIGSFISFYINGDLVWSGYDSVATTGRVGLTGYTEPAWQCVYYFDDVTAGEAVGPAKSDPSPVQEWYNQHPAGAASLLRSPQVPPIACPIPDGTDLMPDKAAHGAFSLENLPTLPVVLVPGASLTFDVRFTPAGPASFADTLVITSDDSASPELLIALTGTATPGGLPVAGTAALAVLAAALATAAAAKYRRR